MHHYDGFLQIGLHALLCFIKISNLYPLILFANSGLLVCQQIVGHVQQELLVLQN